MVPMYKCGQHKTLVIRKCLDTENIKHYYVLFRKCNSDGIIKFIIHILFNHTFLSHGANVQVWAT